MIPTALQKLTGKQIVAIALAVLAALGVTVGVVTDGGQTTVTITVDTKITPSGPTAPTTITTTQGALDTIEQGAGDHVDLGGKPAVCTGAEREADNCVTAAELAAGVKQQTAFARSDKLPDYDVAAAGSYTGCKTRTIGRNYSGRGGTAPRLIVLHQTISPDRGQAGVDAITAYFSLDGPGVSSHFVIAGATDACNYIVPTSQKAWTQVGFNSLAVSIEVTGNQSQGYYSKGGGRTRLAATIARIGKAWNIPVRRGAVSGCTVTRSGVVDHVQLGNCGGNHSDVNPYRAEIAPIIERAAHYRRTFWASPDTKRCEELRYLRERARWRKRVGRTPTWTKERTTRARALKRELGAKEKTCR